MYEPWINGIIKKWSNDIPDGELYEVSIHKDKTVTSTYGRFAHSSGSKQVSWREFMSGEMNELVSKTTGDKTLAEIKDYIRKLGI